MFGTKLSALLQMRDAIEMQSRFIREASSKEVKTVKLVKRYGLRVFNKRVANRETFISYPYGYARLPLDEDVDMSNVDTLSNQ